MIKKEDLRIGNWIKDGHDFEQVTSYHIKCVELGRCEYDPIELTEEILLKCGFNKHINQATLFTLNDVDVWFVNGKFCNILDVEIKYYHQLQNYYYSQKLEELNYTP